MYTQHIQYSSQLVAFQGHFTDDTSICYMASSTSGQDGAILPAKDCPFCSRNDISPKSKRVHESFLSQSIFRGSKKGFL